MKPFDPEELLARVATALNRSADLRGASPLTGLPGNFEILRRIEELVASPTQDFAFMQADLDSFKAYNDHYGSLRGDEAIRPRPRCCTTSRMPKTCGPSATSAVMTWVAWSSRLVRGVASKVALREAREGLAS